MSRGWWVIWGSHMWVGGVRSRGMAGRIVGVASAWSARSRIGTATARRVWRWHHDASDVRRP